MQRSSAPLIFRTSTLVGIMLAVVVLLLALALRIHLLGVQSLWNDEGNAYVQATRSFTEIADHAARDIHPPGYYWLLAAWRVLVGETEFALRALSAFASVLSIAFVFALGKRLYGVIAGLTAALLVALNTFSIYYAQEARMYALLALWGVASMWILARILMSQESVAGARVRKIVLLALPLALINVAGLYTQYAYVYVLLAQGGIVLLWLVSALAGSRKADRPVSMLKTLAIYVTASLIALALFVPWLPVALQQIATWPNTGQTTPIFEAL
ncbi:MAG: glycosyltransferase family 39 protein, partial [Anaerolineae bacterium]|nr:glycosyltransferase family 39 protein [Anaerolineae bacterium]